MNIGDKQIHAIDNVKKYLNNLKNSDIDLSRSSQCFFFTGGETPGQARLEFWRKGWIYLLKFWYTNLKSILAIASHTKYIELGNDKVLDNAKILVVSWAFKNSFQSDGSFYDKYFNENSKDLQNSYWVLISMDNYVPTNLNNNLKVLKQKKGFFKYNFVSFFKILISIIFECKFSIKKIFHYLSFSTYFAKQMSLIIKKELKKNNFNMVLMPYEAQPFQHTIFSEAKRYNKKILTVGYIHSMLTPLPCEFIFRHGAPDLLCVHGVSQIEILKSRLNWPENRLLLIKSLRFRIENNRSLSGKIFLPLTIVNKKRLIKAFKNLLINCSPNSFIKLEVMNHPAVLNSEKHISLKTEIENLMKIYKDKFSNTSLNNKTAIYFGVTTSIFVALEKGIKVIHICADPVFESLSKEIWPNLEIKKLNDFVFQYNLISKRKYIDFGNKNITLNQTVKTLY